MAIVQISQITNRKGLQIDLPSPLAGAELGWSTDERRLFIGNGTLADGAPVIGNTEILTEFSDIIAGAKYTYTGEAATGYVAQTGPSVGAPVQITQQNWMDQFATVKDFGAVGDGTTDDTAAINRALYQLYCVQPLEVSTRRKLFFPAGVYLVTDTIDIPSNAALYGEGPDNSIILLDSLSAPAVQYVAQYTDSAQQAGTVNPIENIQIADMQFQNNGTTTDVFLVQSATRCSFNNVAFVGSRVKAQLINDVGATYAIQFDNTAQESSNIVFDNCLFTGTSYAVDTILAIKGVVFNNSEFNTLFRGVYLHSVSPQTLPIPTPGPTGVRITNSVFDNIYGSGIIFGGGAFPYTSYLNASGYNTFYDVANSFLGLGAPATVVIGLYADNNVSIGDMFERDADDALLYQRVQVDGQNVIAFSGGEKIEMGSYTRVSGQTWTTPGPVAIIDTDASNPKGFTSFVMNYSFDNGSGNYRTGAYAVAITGTGPITTSDDYVENTVTGLVLVATQAADQVTITATSGVGVLQYSINYLN